MPSAKRLLSLALSALPFFFLVLVLHYQLGKQFPLVQPAEVWHSDATQATIQSYGKLSWILLGVVVAVLMLTLFLPKKLSWLLGPMLGGAAGAIASYFLIPFYL